ncbi:MAG: hypothetical protein U0791_23490 [Gemmataceae bacterium]
MGRALGQLRRLRIELEPLPILPFRFGAKSILLRGREAHRRLPLAGFQCQLIETGIEIDGAGVELAFAGIEFFAEAVRAKQILRKLIPLTVVLFPPGLKIGLAIGESLLAGRQIPLPSHQPLPLRDFDRGPAHLRLELLPPAIPRHAIRFEVRDLGFEFALATVQLRFAIRLRNSGIERHEPRGHILRLRKVHDDFDPGESEAVVRLKGNGSVRGKRSPVELNRTTGRNKPDRDAFNLAAELAHDRRQIGIGKPQIAAGRAADQELVRGHFIGDSAAGPGSHIEAHARQRRPIGDRCGLRCRHGGRIHLRHVPCAASA